MNPASGNRGQSYSVTATISSTATPPLPPSGAPVASFTVGTITVSNPTYTTGNGNGIVTGTLTIPSSATPNSAQTVTITFSPPPGQQSGPSYSQNAAFLIN